MSLLMGVVGVMMAVSIPPLIHGPFKFPCRGQDCIVQASQPGKYETSYGLPSDIAKEIAYLLMCDIQVD